MENFKQGLELTASKTYTVHVFSDAVGETAELVASAAIAQFPHSNIVIRKVGMIRELEALAREVEPHLGNPAHIFLYTFARGELHDAMRDYEERGARVVDILGPTIRGLELITQEIPSSMVGALRTTDKKYFERIAAMEYTVDHDDGRRPSDLIEADIVLVGISRTSKTPLAMYLAYRGYKTANVPLAQGVEPPEELFSLDPAKIFGLISTPEVLLNVRLARMKEFGTHLPGYADREYIEQEIEEARALFRQLGCLVINTANRAVEEIAQEILGYMLRNSK